MNLKKVLWNNKTIATCLVVIATTIGGLSMPVAEADSSGEQTAASLARIDESLVNISKSQDIHTEQISDISESINELDKKVELIEYRLTTELPKSK